MNKLSQPQAVNRPALFLTLLAVTIIGVVAVYSSRAAIQGPAGNPGPAQLYLSPAESTVTAGQLLVLELHADSGAVPVNAIQADLSYQKDKLEFVRIDDNHSAYAVNAAQSGSNGAVHIARGSGAPLIGDHLVSAVIFRAKATGNDATLAFLQSSSLVASDNDTNILTTTAGGTYHLSQ